MSTAIATVTETAVTVEAVMSEKHGSSDGYEVSGGSGGSDCVSSEITKTATAIAAVFVSTATITATAAAAMAMILSVARQQ